LTTYHDEEWGVPLHDDRGLFELLTLEGAQAGLNWLTILLRRDGYRAACDGMDPAKIARYSAADVERLLADPGVIRHRGKLESMVSNARAFLETQSEFGSFDAYIWQFVGGAPRVNRPAALSEIPAETAESALMSKDLRKRGFRFVGPTICYAFMQAAGLVDDHVNGCFRAI
jgi:DNA-3-methyladenine glycosylase I